MRGRMSCCRCWPINGACSRNECSCRGTDLVSWGAEKSSVQGRGAWRRGTVTRRTTSTTAGGKAGEAIGRLGGRQDAGRGASSESVMLARHVSNNFVDFLPLHIK